MRLTCKLVFVVALSGLLGCGGSETPTLGTNAPNNPIEIGSQGVAPIQAATEFPTGLPQDALQPWESVGANGYVVPAGNKGVSATSASTEFFTGTQTHTESGDTSSWNGALRMASGAVGSGELSYAIYRIPLGGSEPGVVSVDANLRPMGNGNLSRYHVGLADYGNGGWQWFGPVTDAHWRISSVQLAPVGASFTSGFGNVFVCVVVHDGATIDVVGVGVDPVDIADTTAPVAPPAPTLTPVAGGLLVDWTAVGGSDIAGYKLYYKDSAYTDLTAFSANTLDTLHDSLMRLSLVDFTPRTWWVAVSAVDLSGNESVISPVVSAMTLAGTAPQVAIDVTGYSVQRGGLVLLIASGADTYDWDLDGDGIFDIMGDNIGMADVDTSQIGLIRPLVRGTDMGGTSVALSAVSVIVSGNARPVAVAIVDLASGTAPHAVVFTGTDSTDFDGSIVGGGWDFDGDGTYDVWDGASIVHVTGANHTYTTPGTYNAKLRVVDGQGAWDVDTVTVTVQVSAAPTNLPPVAIITSELESEPGIPVRFDGQQSHDLDGTVVQYEWDLDGDGSYEVDSTPDDWAEAYFAAPGVIEIGLRVTDDAGAQGTTAVMFTVHGFLPAVDAAGSVGQYTSLAIVDGNPAISYYDRDNGDLKYVRATDASGTIWNTPVAVDTAGDVGQYTSLVVVAGNPAISYYDFTNGDLKYVRATDTSGTSWGTPVVLDTSGSVGQYTSLAIVAGNPAISYYDQTNGGLKYVRAMDTSGTIWDTSLTVDTAGTVGLHTSLAIVAGKPAISYYSSAGGLRYVRATDASGTIWDFSLTVDTAGTVGQYNSLAVVNGNPAISYFDSTNGDLKYIRATDISGTSWGTPLVLDTSGSGTVGQFTSLAIVAGKPAISYYDQQDGLTYVWAMDASGTIWDTPLTVDTAGTVGLHTSLVVVDGNPAISYYDQTNYDLRYVVLY